MQLTDGSYIDHPSKSSTSAYYYQLSTVHASANLSVSGMTGAWSTASKHSHISARPGVIPSPYSCILLAPLGKTTCSGDWLLDTAEGEDVNRYAFHENIGPPRMLTDTGAHTQHTLELLLTLPANCISICITSYPSLSKGWPMWLSHDNPLSQTENTK